jgi:MEDS: MEthanogen/methylotroph, DcmR Sensory domain
MNMDMMPNPQPHDASGHFHAVRFYENKASLCRTVADFLCEGLALGQPGLVIATPAHREAVLSELRSRRFDVDKVEAAGDLLLLDARDVLATIMIGGIPDATLFKTHLPAAIDRLCRGRQDCTIRAYGEMVDVLWQDGLRAAAIRLEMLWNQLAMTHDYSLLCGYAMGSFYKDAGMRDVCAQHSHVIATESALNHRADAPIS